MNAVVKIECINDWWGMPPEKIRYLRSLGLRMFYNQYWAAEIVGLSDRYGFERRFLEGHKDYANANALGTRGVYVYYLLEPGKLYEISAPKTRTRIDRYYCTVTEDGRKVRLTKEEVLECLKSRLE